MTGFTEMHSDLMRASGSQTYAHKRDATEFVDLDDVGHRCTAAHRSTGHLQSMARTASDGGIQARASLDSAPDERLIFLFDFAIVELARELAVSGIVLRDDHHT